MATGTTSTTKRTKPVPVPRALPAAVHYTARAGCKTLQEQMRLHHDSETFRKIVKLIRRTAARHVDLELRYYMQDPQKLKKITQEVLDKCPLLGEVYVDAWPITSYLRIALKYHQSPETRLRILQQQHKSELLKKNTESPLTSRVYVAVPSRRQGVQRTQDTAKEASGRVAGFHAQTTSVRRATGHTRCPSEEAVREILDLSDDGYESDKDHASPSPSGPPDDAHPETYHIGAEAAPSGGVAGSPQDNVYQESESDDHSEYISYCIPDRDTPSSPSSTAQPEHPRPDTTHTTRPTPDTMGKARSHAGLPSAHPFAIRDMLIARGLPVADAQRVALLMSSLGIVDMAGLRVFSRLTVCDSWILEMRQKESLNEMEAEVIRDLLDTARATESVR